MLEFAALLCLLCYTITSWRPAHDGKGKGNMPMQAVDMHDSEVFEFPCQQVTDPPYFDKIFKLLQALQFYYAQSQSTVIHCSHPAKVALLTAASDTVLLQYLLLFRELLTEAFHFSDDYGEW